MSTTATRALLYYASMAVGGSGTVFAAAYEVMASDDRSGNVPDDRTLRVVAGVALLGVLGLLLETVA